MDCVDLLVEIYKQKIFPKATPPLELFTSLPKDLKRRLGYFVVYFVVMIWIIQLPNPSGFWRFVFAGVLTVGYCVLAALLYKTARGLQPPSFIEKIDTYSAEIDKFLLILRRIEIEKIEEVTKLKNMCLLKTEHVQYLQDNNRRMFDITVAATLTTLAVSFCIKLLDYAPDVPSVLAVLLLSILIIVLMFTTAKTYQAMRSSRDTERDVLEAVINNLSFIELYGDNLMLGNEKAACLLQRYSSILSTNRDGGRGSANSESIEA